MKRRVKINKLPKGYMQNGGPVSKTLGAVPREFANLEAEKGEVIATQDKGDLALFTIGGKRHSEGGTPMRRPAGDFIWSDTKKMKIKDEDVLKEFGASKAATPAKLAKKFLDTNDYRAILDDPKSDDMAKKTAAMMLQKNKEKLARLAFVQEEMKGFPQGIPGIAQDYAASIGVPMAQYGGAMLPKAQFGMYGVNLNPSAAKGYAEALQGNKLPADREVSNSYLDAITEGDDYSLTEASFTGQGSPGASDAELRNLVGHIRESSMSNGSYHQTIAKPTFKLNAPKDDPRVKNLFDFHEAYLTSVDDGVEFLKNNPDYLKFIQSNYGKIAELEMDAEKLASQPSTSNTLGTEFNPFSTGRSMSESMFGTPGANFPKYNPVLAGEWELSRPSQPARPSASSNTRPAQGSSGSQSSSSTGPRRVPVYSQEYQDLIRAGQDADNFDITAGATAYENGQVGTRPARQGRRADGTYGEEDFTPIMDDFYQRNPFVLEERPDFDRTSEEDDLWFQKRFEELNKEFSEATGLPYVPYFVEGDEDGRGFDGKFGEHTYNATIGRTKKNDPVNLPAKETPQIRETEIDIDPVEEARRKEAKPFEQDLRNERVLARNRLSERKRYPWRGRLAGRAADPLYQSDVNQQQNLQAQQAIASAAAAGFADPNALMSNLSRLSGLTGDKSNQIAAQIQRENTNIGNQFEQFNTQLAAQTDVRNLANAQDLYDNTIKTDEVFDEKMRRYNLMQNAARNMTDTNLARINAENQMNPYWTINTGEGPQFGNFEWQSDAARAKYRGQLNSPDASAKAYQQYLDMDARIMEMGLSKAEEDKLRGDNFRKYEGFTKSNTAAPSQGYNQYIPWTQPSFMGGSETAYQKYGGSTARRKKKK